jgi:hypothetical protein
MALYACAAPQPRDFAVPVIEKTDALVVAESTAEPQGTAPEEASVFTVTFAQDDASAPLKAMRMVMEPGGGERAVQLVDDDLLLTGTAEAIPGGDRWLVGVSGVTSSSCIVVRMTAERDGHALRGWATIDADGRATALPFVAEPTG